MTRPSPRALTLALTLLTCAAYAASLHPGIVSYDTNWLVRDNPLLNGGALSSVPAIVWDMSLATRMVLGAEYLPMRDLSVLLDFALFGDNYLWHHVVNLLWYALGCALFFDIARRLLGDDLRGFGAALLYALHPTHVESVSWLASRKDVLSLVFFYLALRLGLFNRDRVSAWLSAGLMLLAIWAKNTAIMLPGLLVMASVIVDKDRPGLRWGLRFVPWAVVGLCALAISTRLGAVVGMYAEPRSSGLLELVLLQGRLNLHYLSSMMWPVNLSVSYPDFDLSTALPINVAGAALWAVMVLTIPLAARRLPLLSFGLAWWFVALSPVSHFIPLQNLVADRYLLIPSGGLILAGVSLLPRAGALWTVPWVAASLALAPLTWQRCAVWYSSDALWGDAWSQFPGDAAVAVAWAGAVERYDPAMAESILADSLVYHPEDPRLVGAMGVRYMERGDLEQAELALGKAVELGPGNQKFLNNYVVFLNRQQRWQQAAYYGSELVTHHPAYAKGWNSFGLALMNVGDLSRARGAFMEALKIDSKYVSPTCNLGLVHHRAGDLPGAQSWWRRCLELEPGNSLALQGLAAMGVLDAGEEGAGAP